MDNMASKAAGDSGKVVAGESGAGRTLKPERRPRRGARQQHAASWRSKRDRRARATVLRRHSHPTRHRHSPKRHDPLHRPTPQAEGELRHRRRHRASVAVARALASSGQEPCQARAGGPRSGGWFGWAVRNKYLAARQRRWRQLHTALPRSRSPQLSRAQVQGGGGRLLPVWRGLVLRL